MIPLLLAAVLEIPVAPRVSVPVPTVQSRTVLASSGDELLAAWIDSRDRAVHAVRISPAPRIVDREDIRFVPPNDPYASYYAPAVTPTDGGYVLVFERRFTEHYSQPEVLAVRIDRDGALLDREPRVVAGGEAPSIAANGTTILITWKTEKATRGRLFNSLFEPIADVAFPSREVGAIVPRPRGYLVMLLGVLNMPSELSAARVGDDGAVGEESDIGPAYARMSPVAAAASSGGAILLYSDVHELREAIVGDDARVAARRDLGRCDGEHFVVTGLARHERGYLATAICNSILHTVLEPPPPVYDLFTLTLGPNGEPHELRRAAERTAAFGLALLRGRLYTVIDNRTANVALVVPGRLFEPLALSIGQPQTIADSLVPTDNGALAFWRTTDVLRQDERLTPAGVDAAMFGRVISPTCYLVASTGRELLCIEASNTARVMTMEGQPLRSFAVRGSGGASDGAHWIVYDGWKSPLRVVRTALDGSQAEERTFDTDSTSPMLQCSDGACLLAWITNGGELWTVLLRGDRPLASARPQRFDTGVMWQEGAVGAMPNAFLIARSMGNGSVRVSIVSAADLSVQRELTLGTYPPGTTPFLAAGGSADGFELVLFRQRIDAYRIDAGGDVHSLGSFGDGPGGVRVVRSGGHGYVVWERDRHVVAAVTE